MSLTTKRWQELAAKLTRRQSVKYKRKGMGSYMRAVIPVVLVDEKYECSTLAGGTKYWHLHIMDNGFNAPGYRYTATVKYGKSNTRGMTSVRQFTATKACNAWATGKIEEKIGKGYQLVCPANNGSVPSVAATKKAALASAAQIKIGVQNAAKNLFNDLPVGIEKEVIVTVIVGGEVIQETLK